VRRGGRKEGGVSLGDSVALESTSSSIVAGSPEESF